MPASRRHRDHLSAILDDNRAFAKDEPICEPVLAEFVERMSRERVRVSRTDWQGQRVDAMLWHFPDLKPAVKAVVAEYVARRWGALRKGMSANDSPSIDPGESGGMPAPPPHPTEKHQPNPQKALGQVTGTPERHLERPLNPNFRRDWFDRLTDWVAAIVTLWK